MPRKTKATKAVEPAVPAPINEEANRRALDEVAGVTPVRSSLAPPPVTRPANAQPLIDTDTREKLLYKIACTGTPLGSEFFDQFTSRQEILELTLDISARLCAVAICNPDLAPPQRIAAMRVVAALSGKAMPATDEEPATGKFSSPPLSIPTGTTSEDIQRSLDKFRDLSKAS